MGLWGLGVGTPTGKSAAAPWMGNKIRTRWNFIFSFAPVVSSAHPPTVEHKGATRTEPTLARETTQPPPRRNTLNR